MPSEDAVTTNVCHDEKCQHYYVTVASLPSLIAVLVCLKLSQPLLDRVTKLA